MGQVFVSETTGAKIYVFSSDHCTPHVHARHSGEGWTARIQFSFIVDEIEVISVSPFRNAPTTRALGALKSEVAEALPDCRRTWWDILRSVCLEHKWMKVSDAGVIEFVGRRTAGAKQVKSARYNVKDAYVFIVFSDGAEHAMQIGHGSTV